MRIADPVHGTLKFEKPERDVINTRVFQRLRGVKQMGLAYLVYPSADYSRFSHSVGVCHLTGRLLNQLKEPLNLSEEDIQLYRFAGLLHDIGHYPFSHIMEDAIKDHYSCSRLLVDEETSNDDSIDEALDYGSFLKHEQVGKEIVLNNPDIKRIFAKSGISADEVSGIFTREQPRGLTNLISSDLDADRIDYLLRTTIHTGLPYGAVDLEYILSQTQVDGDNRVCLSRKAVCAADHLLISRYYQYLQVPFHKTVAGLELVLKDVIFELLDKRYFSCSAKDVKRLIQEQKWESFDDASVMKMIHDLHDDTDSTTIKLKCASILGRRPLYLAAGMEYVGRVGDSGSFLNKVRQVRNGIGAWAEHFDIDEDFWKTWHQAGRTLTTVGSVVPLAQAKDDFGDDQLVRIVDKNKRSLPIVELKQSLMSVLSNYALYALRVYVLLPGEMNTPKVRKQITKRIKVDTIAVGWG